LAFEENDEQMIEKKIMDIALNQECYADVLCEDGIGHTLWLCSPEDSDAFEELFSKIPNSYICDGHHRTASAYNLSKGRRDRAIEKGIAITGQEDFNFFMALHYPVSNLNIMDYNRVIKSLKGLSTQEFLDKVSESYTIRKKDIGETPNPKQKFESSLLIENEWYEIRVKPEKIDNSSPIRMVDSFLLT